jgi:hypothetical protein
MRIIKRSKRHRSEVVTAAPLVVATDGGEAATFLALVGETSTGTSIIVWLTKDEAQKLATRLAEPETSARLWRP